MNSADKLALLCCVLEVEFLPWPPVITALKTQVSSPEWGRQEKMQLGCDRNALSSASIHTWARTSSPLGSREWQRW